MKNTMHPTVHKILMLKTPRVNNYDKIHFIFKRYVC